MTLRSIKHLQSGRLAPTLLIVVAVLALYLTRAGSESAGPNGRSAAAPPDPAGKLAAGQSFYAIPTGAHSTGALGTNWRTDLEVHNPGATQASYTIALLKRDTDNSSPVSQSFSLEPGRAARYTDIIDSVFHFYGAAALRVTLTSGSVLVTSRTYNALGDGNPLTSPTAPPSATSSPPSQPTRPSPTGHEGRLIHLAHRDPNSKLDYRTNIGYVNTGAATIALVTDLYTADGVMLGTVTESLRPTSTSRSTRSSRASPPRSSPTATPSSTPPPPAPPSSPTPRSSTTAPATPSTSPPNASPPPPPRQLRRQRPRYRPRRPPNRRRRAPTSACTPRAPGRRASSPTTRTPGTRRSRRSSRPTTTPTSSSPSRTTAPPPSPARRARPLHRRRLQGHLDVGQQQRPGERLLHHADHHRHHARHHRRTARRAGGGGPQPQDRPRQPTDRRLLRELDLDVDRLRPAVGRQGDCAARTGDDHRHRRLPARRARAGGEGGLARGHSDALHSDRGALDGGARDELAHRSRGPQPGLDPGLLHLRPAQAKHRQLLARHRLLLPRARRAARYTDIIDSVFHFYGAAAFRITVTSGSVLVTSSTYNALGDGNPRYLPDGATFGHFVPAFHSRPPSPPGTRAA